MDGWITIGTELDTKKFDAQIVQLERKANELEKELSSPKAVELMSSEELLKLQSELEKTKNKLVQLRQQKKKLEDTAGTRNLTSGVDMLGNSFQNAVSKASRLALSIFGIRSAYNALKRASSDLATYDEQYATNLEYIRFVLTQAIAPVLRGIVQLAMQLLSYVNAIAQAWFGINLFSSGSAEQFKKMKAQASGVSKSVKEIKKQLTGFDEVNILTDQSDTGTSVGGATPSMDISGIQGETPEWLKWIMEHKDTVLAILGGIAGGILAIKLGLGGIKALGIGLIITGIITAVQGILGYLEDPSWENFGKTIEGIGLVIAGFGLLIGNIPLAIAGAIVAIVGIIIKYWDQIKAFLQGGIDWLTGQSDWIHENFGDFIGDIYDNVVKVLQNILDWFDSTFKAIKRIFDGIIQFVSGVFSGDWEKAWEGIKNIFGGIWDFIKNTFFTLLDIVDNLILTPLSNFFHDLWENIKTGAQNAWEGVKSIWNNVTTFFKNIFTNAWNAVKNVFSTGGKIFDGIKEGIVNAFKNIVNGIIDGINRVIALPFNAINNVLSNIRNISIAGFKPFTFIHTFNVPQIPRLKTGGIVNMPNKGTMIGGNAIVGESGREGVLPLTDAQAMAELGREIGKNVVVNNTVINKMNSRVISREMIRTQSEQAFAFNK